jgi:hypothetical protein
MIRQIDYDKSSTELVKKLNDHGFFANDENENNLLKDVKEKVRDTLPQTSVFEYQVK